MAAIAVNAFGGEVPRTDPRLLENNSASVAVNCNLERGSLLALRSPARVEEISGEAGTIFKHDVDGWLTWPGHVSVIKSAVLDVDGETPIGQLLVTGDRGYPTMYLAGGEVYRLGIPRPTQAPILNGANGAAYADTTATAWVADSFSGAPGRTASGGPVVGGEGVEVEPFASGEFEGETNFGESADFTDSGIARSSAYCYTLVRSAANGALQYESAPSPPTEVVDVLDGDGVSLSGFVIPELPELNVTAIRIYRTLSGTQSSDFHFLTEISLVELEESGGVYVDSAIDAAVSSEILQTSIWDAIPDDAKGLIKTDNGIYAVFRGNELLVSEPFIPYAFPAAYALTVEDSIVALSHTDGTIVVLTRGRPYLARGAAPESLELVHLPIEQACVSASSVATMPGGVLYASPDGLMLFTGSSQELVTGKIFTRDQWQALEPETLMGAVNDGAYIGFFRGTNRGFQFHLDRADVTWIELDEDWRVTALCHHSVDDAIYLAVETPDGHGIYKFNAGEALSYRWRSRKFFTSALAGMSAVRVDGAQDEDNPVRMRVFAGNDDIHPRAALNLTQAKTCRIPVTRSERLWSFELSGTADVYEARLAGSVEGLEYGQ